MDYLPVSVGGVLREGGLKVGGIVAAVEGVGDVEGDDTEGAETAPVRSKVRSTTGLLVHCYGKLTVCCFRLLFNS